MRNFILAAVAALITAFLGFGNVAEAGQSCKKGYRYDLSREICVQIVKRKIGQQDDATRGGPQWGPVSATACAQASREQEGNARRCRAYDARGANGKELAECAKCCRQLREDMNRWRQCAAAGLAPPFSAAKAAEWKRQLDCDW
jgi:hypothetical protein